MVTTSRTHFYTKHTAKVGDDIDTYYTDSGAPRSSDYTTLVILHGSAFNGAVFLPLHQFAHKANLRVVLCNRREYYGTTRYSDEELADLTAGRQVFQDRHAFQLASFLGHFITTEGIPELSSDRKSGGLILLGWSIGNATTLSFLANPKAFPKHLYELIEPYVMSVIVFDPPHTALGHPPPTYDGAYYPFDDPDYLTPERFYEFFLHWVSSHYDHTDIASKDASGFDHRKGTENWTVDGWSDEQKSLCIESAAATRTDMPLYAPPIQALLKTQTYNVFFNEELITSHFPNVHIFYLVAKNSTWFVIWAYVESMRLYKEAMDKGQTVRTTDFHLVDGANHFLHYEMPELMLQLIVAGGRRESMKTD